MKCLFCEATIKNQEDDFWKLITELDWVTYSKIGDFCVLVNDIKPQLCLDCLRKTKDHPKESALKYTLLK